MTDNTQWLEDYINDPDRDKKEQQVIKDLDDLDIDYGGEHIDNPSEVELDAGEYLISFVESRYSRKVHCEKRQWHQIIGGLETYGDEWSKKDGPGLVPAVFGDGPDKKKKVAGKNNPDYGKMDTWRQKHCARDVRWILLDVEDHPVNDDGTVCSVDDIKVWYREHFGSTKGLIWSSYNHGVEYNDDGDRKWKPGEPRLRVMIPLAEPMSVTLYEDVFFDLLCDHLDGAPDDGTCDVTRINYAPRKPNPQMRRDVEPFLIAMSGSDFNCEDVDFRQWGADYKGLDTILKHKRKEQQKESERQQKRVDNLKSAGIKVPSSDDGEVHDQAIEWLEKACTEIVNASGGRRNHTICQKAYWIGTLVGAGMLEWDDAEDALIDAAETVLPSERVMTGEPERAVLGGLEAGTREPFDVTNLIGTVDVGGGETEDGQTYFMKGHEEEVCTRLIDDIADETGQQPGVDDGTSWVWDDDLKVWNPVDEKEEARLIRKLIGWNDAPVITEGGEKIKSLRITSGTAIDYLDSVKHYIDIDRAVNYFDDAPPSISCWHGGSDDDDDRCVVAYNDDTRKVEVITDDDMIRDVKPRVSSNRRLTLDGPKPKKYIQTLRECWQLEDDKTIDQMIQTFQEWVGVSLLGLGTEYETAIVLPGEGDNGKSTILRAIKAMIDSDYVTSVPVQDWSDNNSRWKKTSLIGSVINVVEELPSRDILESENFKRILEGQEMQFERKGEQVFWSRSMASHICSANSLPHTSDMTHGFWKRLLVLPFSYQFTGDEIDTQIRDKLADEYDQIFSWFIEGAIRLVERGVGRAHLIHPDVSDQAKEQWKSDCDPVLEWIRSETVPVNDAKDGILPSEAWQEFKLWAERNRSGTRLKSNTFYKKVAGHGYKSETRPYHPDKQGPARRHMYRMKTPTEKKNGLTMMEGQKDETSYEDLIEGIE